MDTQVEILKGDGIALDVIGQLELQKNPAFLERTWFQRAKAAVLGWLPGREEGGEKTETDRLLKIFKGGLTVGQVKNSRLSNAAVRWRARTGNLMRHNSGEYTVYPIFSYAQISSCRSNLLCQ